MTKFYLSLSRYLTVLLLLVTTMAWSQSKTVTGKVTSADDGTGLPGVNVIEKGTSKGTVTDGEGNFSFSVGDNATLVFSFVGYASQEVAVGAQTVVNVTMQLDVTALSEVVVIGYGEVNKKDATGAVVSVKAADFNGGLIASPEQLIQGKTAGVQMTTTSGAPGAGVQLRIRGTNSIRSNNNPLFVVDGVPLSGGTQPSAPDLGLGTISDTNPLNFINPSDIESINILKDASATAIYGSRGANGVVIITTKRGKGAKGVLDFSSSFSFASPAKTYDLLNRDQFLNAVDDYGTDPSSVDFDSNTDWQNVVLRNSVSNKQNLSYQRGFKTGSILASFGYDDQQGVLENSYMKRLTGKLNGSKSFFDDKLNIDLSTTFSNVKRQDPPLSSNAGSTGDILGAAYMANPTFPNDPTFDPGGMRNPANMLQEYRSTGATNRILANISANYKITPNLIAKATYGYDGSVGDRVTLVSGKAIAIGDNTKGFGSGQFNENRTTSNLIELTLNYNKTVGENIVVDLVGGYSYQNFRNKYLWAIGKGYTNPNDLNAMEDELMNSYDAADAAAGSLYGDYNNWGVSEDLTLGGNHSNSGYVNGILLGEGVLERDFFARPSGVTVKGIGANFYDQTDFLQSYFGRGNFTINNKYLITATVRIDGSSKFGSDNQYGVFPSGAIAWKLSEEDFMPEVFSTFKLRVGYGIVGNQDGLAYGQARRRERWGDVGVGNNREINVPGSSAFQVADPSLKWESTAQTAVGIDFGIINEKLTGSIDYYNKVTSDLLLRYEVAQPALSQFAFGNIDGKVVNKGWELSLAYQAIKNEKATFTVSGNVSHNKNEFQDFAGILNAGTIYGQGLTGAYAQRLAQGQPLFSYFLRPFEGFGADGQPVPATDVQSFVGKSALPTWNFGLSLNATYKHFDFSAYFSGQTGQYIYNNTRNAFFTAGSLQVSHNVTTDIVGNGESGAAEASVSERFLEKGDFFRAQNITLGYRLPLESGKVIKNLRFYVTTQNLFVITNYSGLDPEVSTSPADNGLLNNLPTAGIDYGAYPKPRVFTIGLNASF